ncbi:hypothetical protein ACC745_38380, partial [Rhizobium ruizarguesonis]
PSITFINKMDRESRDPFEILDEVEEKLALDTAPITWPIGRSKTFCGSYNIAHAADFEKLQRARLDTLGGIDDHEGGVDGGQRAIGVVG